ncbi:hypothetical protein LZK73_18645 [Neorhizobium galegae]|nr:hypothetical protein LZK73_18645 [Neorhizobium galegae]
MRNPAEYSTVPWNGLHVMEVDPGTVITDERTGKKFTVSDDEAVFKGRVMFCTKRIFDRLKEEVPSAN